MGVQKELKKVFYNTTGSTSRQGRGSTDAQASALTLDDKIGDGPYQFSFHMRPAAMNVKLTEITGGKILRKSWCPRHELNVRPAV